MTVIIDEKLGSRETTMLSEDAPILLKCFAKGSDDDAEVKAAALAYFPSTFDGRVLQDIHIDQTGPELWDVDARYSRRKRKETGESTFSFDTGGGTQKITQSLETVHRYARSGDTAPDCKGAIGVADDKVEGTEITVPVYSFSETHYLAAAGVTGAYKAALFFLTGRVNAATFRGFARGEVLFLGASGSLRVSSGTDSPDWEITFKFAASPNVTGLSVGDVTGIAKQGWEYMWVRYEDAESHNVLVQQPKAVYVERVYEYGDFSELGIG